MSGPWINNAIWLTIFGALYFRATITSDRNIRLFLTDGGWTVRDETIAEVQKRGPLKIYDPRVLLSAIVVSLPGWLAPILSPKTSEVLMLVSIGAFIDPLTLPTIPLSIADLRAPWQFVVKWILAKLDVYLKGLALFCVCFVLTKIPGIAYIGHQAAEAFAVVHGGGSDIFQDVVESGVVAMWIMYLIRMMAVFVHGTLFCLVWGASIALLWMSLQYEANVILHPIPIFRGVFVLFAARVAIDFVNDVVETLIEGIE